MKGFSEGSEGTDPLRKVKKGFAVAFDGHQDDGFAEVPKGPEHGARQRKGNGRDKTCEQGGEDGGDGSPGALSIRRRVKRRR